MSNKNDFVLCEIVEKGLANKTKAIKIDLNKYFYETVVAEEKYFFGYRTVKDL